MTPIFKKSKHSIYKISTPDTCKEIVIIDSLIGVFFYQTESTIKTYLKKEDATASEWVAAVRNLQQSMAEFIHSELPFAERTGNDMETSCSAMASVPTRANIEGETSKESMLNEDL